MSGKDELGKIGVDGHTGDLITIAASLVTLEINIAGSTVTMNINITGSDIMVPMDVQGATIMMPMDVQGATIMMPIDIQAQLVNIEIDIVAQTMGDVKIDINAQSIGNLAVDIKASSVTINANIVGTVNINITAQSVGVSIQGEYQVEAGKQYTVQQTAAGLGAGNDTGFNTNMTAAFRVYTICVTGYPNNYGSANQEIPEGFFVIQLGSTQIFLTTSEAQATVTVGYPTPVKVNTGQSVSCSIFNFGPVTGSFTLTVWGYRV